MARPNCRDPIIITARIKVKMLDHREKMKIATAIVKKQWNTKTPPIKFDL